jgi:hypothetical protein
VGTQLGRYGIIGELNDVEVAAGLRVAEVWRRYDAAMGARRSAPSPGYEVGRGRENQAENARSRRARRAYDAMMAVLSTAERLLGRGLIQAVEDVCVADLVCPAGRLGDVREALKMVAAHFGYGRNPVPAGEAIGRIAISPSRSPSVSPLRRMKSSLGS